MVDTITLFITRLIKVAAVGCISAWALYGAFSSGSIYHPQVAHGDTVTVEVQADAPVLARIADCESGQRNPKTGRAIKGTATQYDKNGQVLMRTNSDKTVDVGYMQINSKNFAEATKLGYDLTKKEDNIAYAKYIYANRGTEPWYSSSSCWM